MSTGRSPSERKLLAAAARLLERGGPDAVTTRAVLAEARLSAPTLYHHFGDKDGLLASLLTDGVANFFAHKDTTLRMTSDPAADLLAAFDSFMDFVSVQPQLFQLLAVQALGNPALLDAAVKWCRERLLQLKNDGRLKVDVSFGAQVLMSVCNGVAMLRAQGVGEARMRKVGHFIYERSLDALLKNGGAKKRERHLPRRTRQRKGAGSSKIRGS
ncbi:MAG TPA: TetR/AcrR family transcriptional regulator [Rhizomicrobium sp.]|jgi:AcrR family transcriptional regulator